MTEMDQLPSLVDNSVLYAQEGHRSQLAYIGQIGNSVPLMYLPLLEDFDRAGRYSWGGATLAYLYRQLSIVCKSDAKVICGSLTLLQLWSWERLHVRRPDIAMHPLAQDMPLGHRSELDHQEDYQVRWEPYTSDILQILPVVSRQGSDLWLSRVPLLCFSIVEMHVPDRVLRQFGRVQPIFGPVDALDRVTQKGRGHIDWARYFTHFVQMWHRWRDYIIPPDEDTVGIGRVEYMSWYWSITRRYTGRPGFNYDMCYEPRDHIERSPVEGMRHLHMMVTDGLQDDMIMNSTQSRYIAMQMYINSVLSQVQQRDSSTSDAGPSEPCAGMSQQPDDAGPPQFSPDVMTFSQHGMYDVGASQILIDEVMTDEITHSHPPQSTVGTYRRQRRHRGSTSTLPQQSQSDLLRETLGSISEDIDSETTQSESCDAILVHDTQSQLETEVDAQVGFGNADFGVGNANADSKVAIQNADFEAGIAYADSMLASGLPITKLPTWQLGDYFGN
ncbi:hypothetical protein Taro_014365 [Colocasia esculenta]|uniref:Aminotransferase-like plant mobile domain-containing protein n=1 Tax=Colocasia esculenta TaxID=4460 RepID=A0A843UIM2_COLES|nr:hypothetical protein [Colocasia esculenta]